MEVNIEFIVQYEVRCLLHADFELFCRPDNLVGQCFGLELHTKFEELAEISVVESAEDCRSICCNLNDRCVSWQV